MATEVVVKGVPGRSLPSPSIDGIRDGLPFRLGKYGEIYAISSMRKQHSLLDEGVYYVANNSGTGVATAAAPTAFSDTAPLVTLYNADQPGNAPISKRAYIDYIRVTQTVVGTGGTDVRIRLVLDNTTPSGGTLLTSLNPNMDVTPKSSVVACRLLPVGIAQSGASRVILGSLQVIPTKTANLTVQDEFVLNFGCVEANYPTFLGTVAPAAAVTKLAWPVMPIIIGPGQVLMVEFLISAQSAASSWTVEAGWWER